MKYLLDTNIVIFALTDAPVLPDQVRDILNSPVCEKYVSIASIWEIEIKHIKRPEIMPVSGEDVVQSLTECSIPLLSIVPEYIYTLSGLHTASSHKDPFDRILISQAKYEEMLLITCDKELDEYNEPAVRSFAKKPAIPS